MKSLSKKKYLRINTLVWGFTIMELLVAVGLLAVVLATVGIVFRYSIDAQRTAAATAETMHTLRAITDQLNMDFAGLRKDAPVIVRYSTNAGNNIRADSIVFFATGDFQTTKQYNNQTVRGNVARIYYGQSSIPDVNSFNPAVCRNKILARKQVILTSDSNLPPPDNANEYQITSPEEQLNEYIAAGCIPLYWDNRPDLDPNDVNDIPSYFAKGVDDFTVQLENNTANGSINWWPESWQIQPDNTVSGPQLDTNSIDLVKFTFTLYDSRGLFKNGRKFEHIVYIGQ